MPLPSVVATGDLGEEVAALDDPLAEAVEVFKAYRDAMSGTFEAYEPFPDHAAHYARCET